MRPKSSTEENGDSQRSSLRRVVCHGAVGLRFTPICSPTMDGVRLDSCQSPPVASVVEQATKCRRLCGLRHVQSCHPIRLI